MVDISVIVITHNNEETIVDCLDSIKIKNFKENSEIIVLDNISSDRTKSLISKYNSFCKIIESDKNLGFAGGNNQASKHAIGQYLLLLNPDTIVINDAIDKIISFAYENPSNLIYGGKTYFNNLDLNLASCWKKQTFWSVFCYGVGLTSLFRESSFFNPEAYGNWQRDSVREVDIVSGCFFLIKKSLWDELGGFDPKFFMYGEEADLCLRAKKIGAQPILCPDATIIHYGGVSDKVRADKMVKLFKAKIELAKRHWNPKWVPFVIFMYKWAALSRWIACSCLSLLKSRYKEFARNWKEIWQRRKEWQAGYL